MIAYDLPVSMEIGGKIIPIRYGWRSIVDILRACADPELDEYSKAEVILSIFYKEEIPAEHLQEALQKANAFIDCGCQRSDAPQQKLMDWEQDAGILIPAINSVAPSDIRLDPDIHWWTVFGWFMGIGDSVFSAVLRIRSKLAKGEKLDKAEREYYLSNRSMINLKNKETPEDQAAVADLIAWMEGDAY